MDQPLDLTTTKSSEYASSDYEARSRSSSPTDLSAKRRPSDSDVDVGGEHEFRIDHRNQNGKFLWRPNPYARRYPSFRENDDDEREFVIDERGAVMNEDEFGHSHSGEEEDSDASGGSRHSTESGRRRRDLRHRRKAMRNPKAYKKSLMERYREFQLPQSANRAFKV
jgi:hypothetical protein